MAGRRRLFPISNDAIDVREHGTMISVMQPRIFGTGLIALDLVIGVAPETPVRCWAGGTCGNVLSILAWLGWDAYPVARMGGDAASQRVRADMARWGVHFDWTRCAPTTPTPIVVEEIRRGRDGRPGTDSPGPARAAASGFRPSGRLRSTRWRGSSRPWRVRRCSFSIACHGRVSTWLPRHRLAAPQSCSSRPPVPRTSLWRRG